MFTSRESGAMAQRGEIQCAERQFALQSGRPEKCRKFQVRRHLAEGNAIAFASLWYAGHDTGSGVEISKRPVRRNSRVEDKFATARLRMKEV